METVTRKPYSIGLISRRWCDGEWDESEERDLRKLIPGPFSIVEVLEPWNKVNGDDTFLGILTEELSVTQEARIGVVADQLQWIHDITAGMGVLNYGTYNDLVELGDVVDKYVMQNEQTVSFADLLCWAREHKLKIPHVSVHRLGDVKQVVEQPEMGM